MQLPGFLQRSLAARLAASGEVTLSHKRIFLLPSKAGWGFIVLLLLVFLLAVNFQNSMAYALCFWLACLFVAIILRTFSSLRGVQVRVVACQPCFAGDVAECQLHLRRSHSGRATRVETGWNQTDMTAAELLDESESQVSVYWQTRKRGHYHPGRLRLQSRYPSGLITAWTWIDFDWQGIAYPKPFSRGAQPLQASSGKSTSASAHTADTEFSHLRPYQPGDSLKRIHWPAYAREGELMSRHFGTPSQEPDWLSWEQFSGHEAETRLSLLCAEVLRLSTENRIFGLRLPGKVIDKAQGEGHRQHCLEALALFEADTSSDEPSAAPASSVWHGNTPAGGV
ncbi:DUF58 domain-containing protein [Pokkaliibacter sp. CJK22405]|uniref:DUF58 domain-containing protein n=1 Tax=Pokkaliibacter sp. CJK22405 TaxID=3384615 RepID=UPI0039852C55